MQPRDPLKAQPPARCSALRRDFMNLRSREFCQVRLICASHMHTCTHMHTDVHRCTCTCTHAQDPETLAADTTDNVDALIDLLRRPPQLPLAIYIELDCWNAGSCAQERVDLLSEELRNRKEGEGERKAEAEAVAIAAEGEVSGGSLGRRKPRLRPSLQRAR